jgi:hypothetical protein
MKLTILLKTCRFGTCAHSTTNTENNTTDTTSTHFPPLIAWNTSPGLPPRRIRTSFHVFTGESKNITQNMPFWHLCTLNHQHWKQHNWNNIQSFATNDGLKHVPWTTYESNPHKFWCGFEVKRSKSIRRCHFRHTPYHQHWIRHNWSNCHWFRTIDKFKFIPLQTHKWNLYTHKWNLYKQVMFIVKTDNNSQI